MEQKNIYPEGTKQETEDFATRQKIKKIVGEDVEAVVKEETLKAFKDLGYKEKDGYMYIVAAGEDGKEKEVGKGTQEGKLNVTISKPKMLNMGAVRPVSYMQKVTTFGGKKLVSELYLEIIDETVNLNYKNTEASAFHQSSNGSTYSPRKLDKSETITGIKDTKSFKSKLKKFFSEIAKAEAEYLTGTKIGNDDKTTKDMNDSIVKESKYSMKLTDLFSSSYEEAGDKINKLVNESLEDKRVSAEPKIKSDEPTDKKLVIGDEEEKVEGEDKVEEITMSTGIGYKTPYAFKPQGEEATQTNSDKNLGYTLAESVKNTTYGMMRTKRAHILREGNGEFKLVTPYTEQVEMEKGHLNTPKGMTKNYAQGLHGKDVNSKEELDNTGHGDLNKIEESNKLNLMKRKFASLSENEEKGINKRYIITEKLSKEEQKDRWKKLYENDCFCGIKDQDDKVTRNEYENDVEKEFENNNKPLESDLCNTPFSGEEEGFLDVPKSKGSMIVFRLAESDVRQNKAYIIDHFTKKLVLNPLFKSKE